MAGMIIQSTPVSFGALGTPILVGVATGLGADPAVLTDAQSAGFAISDGALPEGYLAMIGARVAILHAVIGTLIPLILVSMLTRFFDPPMPPDFPTKSGRHRRTSRLANFLFLENPKVARLGSGTSFLPPRSPTPVRSVPQTEKETPVRGKWQPGYKESSSKPPKIGRISKYEALRRKTCSFQKTVSAWKQGSRGSAFQ